VCDAIREKYKILIPSIYPTAVARDLCSDIYPHGEPSFHAGEVTLSQQLYLFPQDVSIKDRSAPPMNDFRGFKMANPSAIDFKGSTVNLYLDMSAVAPTGGEGHPLRASSETGRVLLERVVDYICDFVDQFKDFDTHG
jgi:creatinine amidohydrolase/Fe(II)-dependent formamide hydrolase-like protein